MVCIDPLLRAVERNMVETIRHAEEVGDDGWTGMFFFGLTWQIYRFIGNDGLLYWLYDAPEAIHALMAYMLDDRTRLFDFMEQKKLLAFNTDNQMAGPRGYGYVSELPQPDSDAPVTVKNLWGWAESQETTCISPEMFKEFFLPYLGPTKGQTICARTICTRNVGPVCNRTLPKQPGAAMDRTRQATV